MRIDKKSKFFKKSYTEAPKIKTGPNLFGRIIGFAGLIVCGIAIFLFIEFLNYTEKWAAPEKQSREVVLDIPGKTPNAEIAKLLKDNGVIKDEEAFLLAFKIKSRIKESTRLNSGEHALDPSMNAWQIISVLNKGNIKYYSITIPEGYNMAEIARLVERQAEGKLGDAETFWALCHDAAFIKELGVDAPNLEGYLFPETYKYKKGDNARELIKQMVGNFNKVWSRYSAAALANRLSKNEVLTLASIVEKETGAPSERPLIASVFFNRLQKKMRLQTDPTVIYGLPNFNGNLTRKDLDTPHPYNTYVIPGLPPGPITNPGEAAIKAVLYPSKKKYLYFVSKNDGTHHFSETLKEHNRMVAQYQRGGSS
jgi:UPF0755 protein